MLYVARRRIRSGTNGMEGRTRERKARISKTLALVMVALAPAVSATKTNEIVVSVPGIPGPYCAYGVEKRLLELDGIERVELLWEQEQIRAVLALGANISSEQIRSAVERADYPYDYRVVQP